MRIFPAVDVQAGRAVRLKRGNKLESTTYADDPVELAIRWQAEGASWLHIIDLDGAFEGSAANRRIIARLTALRGISTQIGGGIRDLDSAAEYLEAGATRLIVGTIALENPVLFRQMCRAFPGKIGVSLDGAEGKLKSRGWLKDSGRNVTDVVPTLEDAGAAFIIYTDIERDGMQSGINLKALTDLLAITTLPVIAAGGVASLDDIANVYNLRGKGNLEGAISGRALCEGSLSLKEALNWIRKQAE